MLLVVASDIFKFETLRKVVVHLDCSELPLSSYGILHHEVELRTIECCLTILDDCIESLLSSRLDDGCLSLLPVLVRTDVLLCIVRVTERYLCNVLIEVQGLEHIKDDVDDLAELLLDLIRTTEQVGIILSEAAHTGESVKLTALLVTVHGTELCKPDRELLV